MRSNIALALAVAVASLGSAHAHAHAALNGRQDDCEARYGTYPPYTGPCEATNCGAGGRDCSAEGYSGCVGYPSVVCPYKGCSCTNF